MNIRTAAAAGRFYEADPARLRDTVQNLLDRARSTPIAGDLRALVAPHAGYRYSGPIAASAYKILETCSPKPSRIVILGTCHTRRAAPISAAAEYRAFATPLGLVSVDRETQDRLRAHPAVAADDTPHAPDHAIEVQLPFLQVVLDDFTLVPLLVARANPGDVAEILAILDQPETLLVVSTDLSHFQSYDDARVLDAATARAVESLRPETIEPEQACGLSALQGLLLLARHRGWRATTLDLRNSGDTAGGRDRVVGYGAFAFSQKPKLQ